MQTEVIHEETLRAVASLLTAFGRCADRGDGAGLAELFLADGTLVAGQQQVSGQAAIARFTDERSGDRITRHTWSNLHVEAVADGVLRATSIQQTFEQGADGTPARIRISDLEDAFEKDDAGQWRFARRQIRRILHVG